MEKYKVSLYKEDSLVEFSKKQDFISMKAPAFMEPASPSQVESRVVYEGGEMTSVKYMFKIGVFHVFHLEGEDISIVGILDGEGDQVFCDQVSYIWLHKNDNLFLLQPDFSGFFYIAIRPDGCERNGHIEIDHFEDIDFGQEIPSELVDEGIVLHTTVGDLFLRDNEECTPEWINTR